MNPDEMKIAWNTQAPSKRLVFDENVILSQVVRAQSDLRLTLYWRDVREIGTALVMVGVFFSYYVFLGQWTWLLVAASMIWVGGFLLVDRIRHRRRHPHRQDSIRACLQSTLAVIEHQIRLLKNVFWWYLLLPLAAMEAVLGSLACEWIPSIDGGDMIGVVILVISQTFVLAVMIGVYLLNQWTVRNNLEPRRQEIEALLRSLEPETPP